MKKLPKIYKNNINKQINNNKNYCYINKDNVNESVEIKTPSNIEETLSSIFKSTGYPYNIKVYIKTNNKEYYTYLVSRTNKTITTLDNDLIKINEIVELKKYPNFENQQSPLHRQLTLILHDS